MSFDPAQRIHNFRVLGEFGGVNPSISDSSTFVFSGVEQMEQAFGGEIEGRYLYSRLRSPSSRVLAAALASMEDGEAGQVMASGMAAISTTLLALCSAGDHIVSARTVYGGTYALMENLLSRLAIRTSFVDITDLEAVRAAIRPETRLLYCETLSNPLLEVSDLPALSEIASEAGVPLVVDNTFSPLIFSPLWLGADVVIHSLTKFINGASDGVAGCVISFQAMIDRLNDCSCGTSMLLGPTLDSLRAASILKNLQTLPLRIPKHSRNAQVLAERFEQFGLPVHYPGLESHPQHELADWLMNSGYGFGGILSVDLGDKASASRFLQHLQEAEVGHLAVSLGYYRTLFSAPGHSTSSEIPADEQAEIGLSEGLVRISVGLDPDIDRTWELIVDGLQDLAPQSVVPA